MNTHARILSAALASIILTATSAALSRAFYCLTIGDPADWPLQGYLGFTALVLLTLLAILGGSLVTLTLLPNPQED